MRNFRGGCLGSVRWCPSESTSCWKSWWTLRKAMKVCKTCQHKLPLSAYHRLVANKSWRRGICKSCHAEAERKRRPPGDPGRKAYLRKYYATYYGYCRVCYSRMRLRVLGRTNRAKYYAGLPICTWDEFWRWAQQPQQSGEWDRCMAAFRISGARRDRPSVDRLSSHTGVGYVPWNMRWINQGDHAVKTSIQRWHGRSAISPDWESGRI